MRSTCFCKQELVWEIENNSETDPQTAKLRRGSGTIGRTVMVRTVIETSSVVDPILSVARSFGICYDLARINFIPIGDPLPSVAVHIVESPGVWSFEARRMSLTASVFIEPSVLAEKLSVVAEAKRRLATSATSILPFRFGR